MRRALVLASKGGKAVFPNPKVGCVIVKNGKIVGEGFHARFGGPHAEAVALARAGARAKGSEVHVTLEPCCAHPGKKTPPCVDALIRAKVSRVFAAVVDPNPDIAGNSLKRLRKAGIKVEPAGCRRPEPAEAKTTGS